MSADINREIKVNLSNPTKLFFTISNSGEKGERMVHEEKIALTKGLLYSIPIYNDVISSKDCFGIKLELSVSEFLRILNVHNGRVLIESIVHGYILENGVVLGSVF